MGQTKGDLTGGWRPVEFDDACIVFDGWMPITRGSFFYGLERNDTRRRTVFEKAKQVVELYPSEITVQIEALFFLCAKDQIYLKHRPPKDIRTLRLLQPWPGHAPDVLNLIQLRVYYMKGGRSWPLGTRFLKEAQPSPLLQPLENPYATWWYYCLVA